MSANHTPTPWDADGTYVMGRTDDGMLLSIADCAKSPRSSVPLGKANAEFIVKAANCHDELIEALRDLIEPYNGWDDFQLERRVDEPTFRAIKQAKFALFKAASP